MSRRLLHVGEIDHDPLWKRNGEEAMRWIKRFIARIFCLHTWEINMSTTELFNNVAVYGQGIFKSYICEKCGKKTLKTEPPISYLKG